MCGALPQTCKSQATEPAKISETGARSVTGRCLCGASTYTLTAPANKIDVCHCQDCQRWTGGPFLGLNAKSVKVEGKVQWYRSSVMAERGFCAECGSVLVWRLRDGRHVRVGAGTLDRLQDLEGVGSHFFADRKPDFYDFDDAAPRVSTAETVAVIEEFMRDRLMPVLGRRVSPPREVSDRPAPRPVPVPQALAGLLNPPRA